MALVLKRKTSKIELQIWINEQNIDDVDSLVSLGSVISADGGA